MVRLGLEKDVVDEGVRMRALQHLAKAGVQLPTFAELCDPTSMSAEKKSAMASADPDTPNPANLFRVNWFNDAARTGTVDVPEHVVLPKSLTGVDAPIVVLFGDRFPMIRAHKVLAAYACLVPRVITGQFDPTYHRAVWPSTGNYCRGGVAISRILNCHGVAVLPEGMSRERFAWLEDWSSDPADIIRTPGSESNVKEIYDECARLDADDQNVIFNQFCEFGNHLAHASITGAAIERVFESLPGDLRLAAFTSATGSGGTIAAGDTLKDHYGTKIVSVEALECPTLLNNGFGEHNIQGIGDKHVPLVHNVMNTDLVVAVSDRATDQLELLFTSDEGRKYLAERRGVDAATIEALKSFGFSSICNVLAAIKTAKMLDYGPNDAIFTVATDGAEMYTTETAATLQKEFCGVFDAVNAGEVYSEHMVGASTDHMLELTHFDKNRIFNLGYFTWVEQQGLSLEEFEARRNQDYWRGLRGYLPIWDEMISTFNAEARAIS